MSLLRDVGDSLIKYGEILIDKTENFTRTARTRIQIRKNEQEISNIKIIIADHVLSRRAEGLGPEESLLEQRAGSIKGLEQEIAELRKKLEENGKQPPSSDEQADDKSGRAS